MIFMVPIAPFSVFGFVWHDARGMVPLAYAVGLLGMFFTAMSYASMSRAFPMAGSVYSYVQRGLHEVPGFFAGWLILLDYILVPALLYIFSAVALQPLLPAVPPWVWLVAFVAFNAVVNLLGVQLSARVNRYMLALELLTLALFMALGLAALHAGRGAGALTLRPVYDPQVFSLATVTGATSIAVLSFLGFDGISTLAEESRGGRESVARATVVVAAAGRRHVHRPDLDRDRPRARHELCVAGDGVLRDRRARRRPVAAQPDIDGRGARCRRRQCHGGPGRRVARPVCDGARWQAAAACWRECTRATRHRMSARSWSPAISMLVGLLFVSRADDLSRIVNFGALTGFLLLHLAVIIHYVVRARSRDWLRHLLMPLGGLLVIGYVLYEMDRSAKLMGAAWIAAGAIYFVVSEDPGARHVLRPRRVHDTPSGRWSGRSPGPTRTV